jgi:hypothetical protein
MLSCLKIGAVCDRRFNFAMVQTAFFYCYEFFKVFLCSASIDW